MIALPRALPVRSVETSTLLGWYPDRGARDVVLETCGGGLRLLLTRTPDGRGWMTGGIAAASLSRLPDFVPREECYAMPEDAL